MSDVAAGILDLLDDSHVHQPSRNCSRCLKAIAGIIRAASGGNSVVDYRLNWIVDYLQRNQM
jgi:hypothetical protein